MKITVATGLYPPEIGGPATHTVFMETYLTQYGYVVNVVPFSLSRSYPKVIRHLHYFLKLVSASRGSKYIFAQDTVSVGLPARLVSLVTRIPLVVRVPGDYAWEQATQRFGVTDDIDSFQEKKHARSVELLKWLQRRTVKGANWVVVPSEYFNQLVCGWGVSKERVVTIYNGIDLEEAPAMPNSAPARPYMVTAARLVPWKGIDSLIGLLQQLPDWQLVIIGDGPDLKSLRSKAQSSQVIDRVTFTGRLPRAEVLGWCKACDAFVLNSSFESFSYQVAEAMSVGANIITTKIGSLPELIGCANEAGLLIQPNDTKALVAALTEISSDDSKWAERRARAVERAQNFSIAATAEKLHQLFQLGAKK